MISTEFYSNRDLDAGIMVRRLLSNLHVTTDRAKERLEYLDLAIGDCIKNYKAHELYDKEASNLRLLIRDREQWSVQGAFDDCTHWV